MTFPNFKLRTRYDHAADMLRAAPGTEYELLVAAGVNHSSGRRLLNHLVERRLLDRDLKPRGVLNYYRLNVLGYWTLQDLERARMALGFDAEHV